MREKKDREFTFVAIAAMCLVSQVTGNQSENELEEIYIQIHQCETLSEETEYALETLNDIRCKLDVNYRNAYEEIYSQFEQLDLNHEQVVEVMNMAIDVVKSNKKIVVEKLDILTNLCKCFHLYSSDF